MNRTQILDKLIAVLVESTKQSNIKYSSHELLKREKEVFAEMVNLGICVNLPIKGIDGNKLTILSDQLKRMVIRNVHILRSNDALLQLADKLMKSKYISQYIISIKLVNFGKKVTSRDDRITIKGVNRTLTYSNTDKRCSFLKILELDLPYLIGLEGRFSRRPSRSGSKNNLSRYSGCGIITCKYMDHNISVESLHYEYKNTVKFNIVPIYYTPKLIDITESLKKSFTEMFKLMDVVDSVSINDFNLVITLKGTKLMKSPLDLIADEHKSVSDKDVTIYTLQDRIESHKKALIKSECELNAAKKAVSNAESNIKYIHSDIEVLIKAIEIMKLS